MSTTSNNPESGDSGSGRSTLLIGTLVVMVIIFLFFIYGLPALRKINNSEVTVNAAYKIQTTK